MLTKMIKENKQSKSQTGIHNMKPTNNKKCKWTNITLKGSNCQSHQNMNHLYIINQKMYSNIMV